MEKSAQNLIFFLRLPLHGHCFKCDLSFAGTDHSSKCLMARRISVCNDCCSRSQAGLKENRPLIPSHLSLLCDLEPLIWSSGSSFLKQNKYSQRWFSSSSNIMWLEFSCGQWCKSCGNGFYYFVFLKMDYYVGESTWSIQFHKTKIKN